MFLYIFICNLYILIYILICSHHILNGLNSIKFLKILSSDKTPNIFSTYQLKNTFKHLNFAPAIFNVFQNTPVGLKHLNLRIFLFNLHCKYPSNVYINKKLHTSSHFAWLRYSLYNFLLSLSLLSLS